ncbi:T9SS type B sorting domain-containing protein [Arsenicibacter rosenii]|nr:gliding motility-associated C-terminal domain-containing protein [Arsenicibacter rosenii]
MITHASAQTAPCPAPPTPPVINGSATAICRGDSVKLTALGCPGTVVWSTNDTLTNITVRPQRTTKYTAICRLQKGCISCFAEVYTITVNTPKAPVLTPGIALACPDDNVILSATGCTGTVAWSNGHTGNTLSIRSAFTSSYQATCRESGCVSAPSLPAIVQIETPVKPLIQADKPVICGGQSVQLTAVGCSGTVIWSDGYAGISRQISPAQTSRYRAVCRIGTCQSDSSDQQTIQVQNTAFKPAVLTLAKNGCPYQTADLSRLIQESPAATLKGSWLFRTGPSASAPAVQSPTAVESGTYYIIFQDNSGCYSEPVAVTAVISACQNAIPVCISNPARIVAWVDSLDFQTRAIRVKAQLRGVAQSLTWQTTGSGLIVDPTSLTTRYLFSDADQQRGAVEFTLSTPDPDGNGPCTAATTKLTATIPARNAPSTELIGLSKKAFDPTWVSNSVVEVSYQLTVTNAGKNQLTNVQVSDNLTRAFTASGAAIQRVTVRTDAGWTAAATYTGQQADTTLLAAGQSLAAGASNSIYLTARIDVGQANTLTFENSAWATATDVSGMICRDKSTNGTNPDPDQNGNPGDNADPTVIALHAAATEGSTVFIPEGFSPNGDGVNDRFVIQQVPTGIRVDLEVLNRWGHVVYRSQDYRNDWDGRPNQGIGAAGAGVPEGTYFYIVRLSNGREFTRFMTISR